MTEDSFEQNPRKKQELKMRPIADDIYRRCWGQDITIKRIERQEDFILDRRFGIDVIITFPSGMIFTGQEKFLSPRYASFKSLTVEYMNDAIKKGDWFNLASQFYFCGYASDNWDEFQLWAIINWATMVIGTLQGIVKWEGNINQDGRARASFRFCKMTELPHDYIIASSWSKL